MCQWFLSTLLTQLRNVGGSPLSSRQDDTTDDTTQKGFYLQLYKAAQLVHMSHLLIVFLKILTREQGDHCLQEFHSSAL